METGSEGGCTHTWRRYSALLLQLALKISFSHATVHEVAVYGEGAVLPKHVGGQRELQHYDEAPQELCPLPALLALTCSTAPLCQAEPTACRAALNM